MNNQNIQNSRGLTLNQPMAALNKSEVRFAGMQDVIWEPLYDTVVYPAAGAREIALFQEAIGNNGKTIADTNMDMNGQISSGKNFMITGIELWFVPSQDSDQGAAVKLTDDVRAFANNGAAVLTILSKDYVRQAPLGSFPQSSRVEMDAATTVASTNIEQANNVGESFEILDLRLASNTNFKLTLVDLAALPSTQDGKIIAKLNGFSYRNVQ